VTYGVSDFVGGVASRRVAALRVMLVMLVLRWQGFGMLMAMGSVALIAAG
jgi:hypothetical protein